MLEFFVAYNSVKLNRINTKNYAINPLGSYKHYPCFSSIFSNLFGFSTSIPYLLVLPCAYVTLLLFTTFTCTFRPCVSSALSKAVLH